MELAISVAGVYRRSIKRGDGGPLLSVPSENIPQKIDIQGLQHFISAQEIEPQIRDNGETCTHI